MRCPKLKMNGIRSKKTDQLRAFQTGRSEDEENPIKRIAPLLSIVALSPNVAWAQSCADQRPNWVPGTDATVLTEAIALLSSPFSLILVIATVLCFRFKSQWGSVLVVVLWTALISLITFGDAGGRAAGMSEGCIGSPSLFIAIIAVISVGLILYTAPRADKDGTSS